MVRFIVNSMHGSLARKLRIFGHDVIYDKDFIDSDIIKLAQNEARTILTSDKELHKIALGKGINSVLISGENDEKRITCVFRSLGLTFQLDPKKSRCPLCNNEIRLVNKADLSNEIPKEIMIKYSDFYSCTNCGKIYWTGSHWNEIKKLSRKVKKSLRV